MSEEITTNARVSTAHVVEDAVGLQSGEPHEAILSNAGGFTAFSFGGYHIRFRAPYSLERYVDVVHWDDGLKNFSQKPPKNFGF